MSATTLFGDTIASITERAIELLREHEPAEGYYLAFSGGKDSCVCKSLLQKSGCKFDAWYSNTTIDPPELVRFIKKHHADVSWNQPEIPMMTAVATMAKVPPTRAGRWCCDLYKEGGGKNRLRVFGVRAAESKGRAERWAECATDSDGSLVICPIVYWSDDEVWAYIRQNNVPYCELYDQGFKRLGCVGCPLASPEKQEAEFQRWPNFERNWKAAIVANWEKYHALSRRDGKPRYHAKFKSGEEFWQWWRNYRAPDVMREDCQSGLLWTNQEEGLES